MTDELIAPAGWKATTLGHLGRYLNGRAFKSSEWSKTGRPIIRIQDLTGSSKNPHFFEGSVQDRYVVRPGDFLISWSATLGAYIWNGPEGVLNQHIFKVESDIDPRFHYHLVRNQIATLLRNAHGSGMVHVTKGVFDSTPVLVPVEETDQRAIADFIDASELAQQSAAGHLRAATRAIERFRKAILVAGCTGRLTADWRDTRATSAAAAVASSDPIEPIAEVPSQWIWSHLSDIADIRGGVQKGAKQKVGESVRAVPYLRVANVQRGWLDLSQMKTIEVTERKIADLALRVGDIFFTEGGDIDKLGRGWVWEGQIEECIHQNHVFRARLRDARYEPKFFSWFGNTVASAFFLAGGKQTVNLASLNMTTLKALPVPVPDPEEQAEIVKRVEALLMTADELMRRVATASKSVERSSQAVLSKAFRGGLT